MPANSIEKLLLCHSETSQDYVRLRQDNATYSNETILLTKEIIVDFKSSLELVVICMIYIDSK